MTKRHVGFTGTRHGMTDWQAEVLEHLLISGGYKWLHHGDCVGADRGAHEIARHLGLLVKAHPPIATRLRAFCTADICAKPRPYLERDQNIVDETEALIATPKTAQPQLGSGTWATINMARSAGKQVTIILPSGAVVRFHANQPPG